MFSCCIERFKVANPSAVIRGRVQSSDHPIDRIDIGGTGLLPTPRMLSGSWNLMVMATEEPLESIGQVSHRWYSNAKQWSWLVMLANWLGQSRPQEAWNQAKLLPPSRRRATPAWAFLTKLWRQDACRTGFNMFTPQVFCCSLIGWCFIAGSGSVLFHDQQTAIVALCFAQVKCYSLVGTPNRRYKPTATGIPHIEILGIIFAH